MGNLVNVLLHLVVALYGVRQGEGAEEIINFSNKSETEIMDELLKGYDPRLRPSYQEGKPTFIKCNMFIRGIANIDQIAMQFNADILFRQQWNDPRVRYDYMLNSTDHTNSYPYLNVYNYSALWTADLYFKNARDAKYHDVIKDQKLLRVSPNGDILYSIRVTMVLTCDMKLHTYPFDSQHCFIRIGSFSQTTKHLVIAWREEKPFGITSDMELPEFKFANATVEEINASFSTGNYSNLRVNFLLEREIGFYMLQVYVPSFMIVIVSWVTFWLDVDAGPARVSLAITTFLTMHTMSSGVRATLPPVSYTKAIDVWTNACTTYIFGALLEYALANYMARRLKKKKLQEAHFMKLVPTFMKVDDDNDGWTGLAMSDLASPTPSVQKRPRKERRLGLPQNGAKSVDVLARILFPTTFLLFNIGYWIMYVAMSQKKEIPGKPVLGLR